MHEDRTPPTFTPQANSPCGCTVESSSSGSPLLRGSKATAVTTSSQHIGSPLHHITTPPLYADK
ncbi:unnamed protein product [Protopolystoma xenopodis]|uniref:Uncharacterized protein n=1 Tax=Protopolystoma xenopodis TaxID=117903 RepID=A0A3S5AQR5_9PLAT|nr:unnamed protein product [Protopolystoma xenopodis]